MYPSSTNSTGDSWEREKSAWPERLVLIQKALTRCPHQLHTHLFWLGLVLSVPPLELHPLTVKTVSSRVSTCMTQSTTPLILGYIWVHGTTPDLQPPHYPSLSTIHHWTYTHFGSGHQFSSWFSSCFCRLLGPQHPWYVHKWSRYFECSEFGWDFLILPAGNLDTWGELVIGGHTISWELSLPTYTLY